MRKLRIAVTAMVLAAASLQAQNIEKADKNLFNHMDIGATFGSTGIGFDITMPAGDYVRIRTGATFMPHFTKNMHFGVQVGDETDAEIQASRFERLADFLEGLTGYRAQNSICMVGKPKFNNFKLLVDVTPFKNNKHWHFTAGFYAGKAKLANAVNRQEDMPSLMAVNIYNGIYWNVYNEQNIITYNGNGVELPPQMNNRILSYGEMSIRIGEFKRDFYATQDMYYTHDVYDKENFDDEGNYVLLHKKGDVQYHKGDLVYKAGDTYRMLPDEDIMVRAKALVNAFRPYVGAGYSTTFGRDKRTTFSVDAGIMFWGGSPDIITHDGVSMTDDLTNVNGQVNDILNVIKHSPVYPVFEIKFARKLF